MLRLLMNTLATFTEKVVEKKCWLCAVCYVLCVWFTIFESPFCNWVNVTLIYLSKSTVSFATTFGAENSKKNRRASQFVIILVIWLGNGGLNNHLIRNHQHWTNCYLFIFFVQIFSCFLFRTVGDDGSCQPQSSNVVQIERNLWLIWYIYFVWSYVKKLWFNRLFPHFIKCFQFICIAISAFYRSRRDLCPCKKEI